MMSLGIYVNCMHTDKEEVLLLAADLLTTLHQSREDLLREYMLARGAERAKVLSRILEMDEQIEDEKQKRKEMAEWSGVEL